MTKCPVCSQTFQKGDYQALAKHLAQASEKNDPFHVAWLQDYVPMPNYASPDFLNHLRDFFKISDGSLKSWIATKFTRKFYSEKPHPFIEAMQKPKKSIFMGYGVEYYFFLRQKIKALAYVIAKTDKDDVQKLEAKIITPNIVYDMKDGNSEIVLLFKMYEGLGITRDSVLASMPLPPTIYSLKVWNSIAESDHWLETMAALNTMDLFYCSQLKDFGAKLPYFSPTVLDNEWIPDSVKHYLKFITDSPNEFSMESLDLIEKYAKELNLIEEVQSSFMRSLDAMDRHLQARLTRSKQYESK
ncbi:MAG: hypothetical protein M1267_04905 [Candidatus Thermoplasmatota archaeon]|jgi:pyrroloquinoline-quinone synthase|nr:hypothetical protein [Candidatus Thermoplasmatota archaeon]MCL5799834.1 hypothetical protein [Candidatus Thermoplasmatota archaeon]